MDDQTTFETGQTGGSLAEVADDTGGGQTPRDYEAEARAHGWTPKEEFRGDPNKWVDSETFVRRADEVMPFLKKQNAALKREMDDLKKTVKQAAAHFSKTEERAYQRALADLEAKHTEAVETGDTRAAKAAVTEMRNLERDMAAPAAEKPVADEAAARQELAGWVDRTGWYGIDQDKTKYADLQADLMGPATEYAGGQAKWLSDLEAKVERKFAAAKPNPTNGGGRPAPKSDGGGSFNDLPPAARAACDKFYRSGVFGDPKKVTLAEARAKYVKTYDFS